MAEGWARALAPRGTEIFSAGSNPGVLHPLAVRVMAEAGVDIAAQRSKSVSEIPAERIGLIVTLCAEEVCPVFPSAVTRLHWPLPDPASAAGDGAATELAFRAVRDELRRRIADGFAGSFVY